MTVRVLEVGLVGATGLVAMSLDSGWAAFSWTVLGTLVGGLVWLLSLRERQRVAEAVAAVRDQEARMREAAIIERMRSLEATMTQHHAELSRRIDDVLAHVK